MTEDTPPGAPAWSPVWTRAEGEGKVSALYHSAFGEPPRVVRSAPGRVTVMGEHTDYSGGLSLATVTQQATYVAASPRTDDEVHVRWEDQHGHEHRWEGTLEDAQPGPPGDNHVKTLGILWSLLERGYVGHGLNLAIVTCVPEHAGLAQGVSVLAGVALAVDGAWGLALDTDAGREELAEVCVEAESGFSGVPTAGMVQHTILRCPPGQALLMDFAQQPPHVEYQPLYFPDYGLGLLLIDTGRPNELTLREYASRWDQMAAACEALGVARLRDLVDAPYALRRIESLQDPVLKRRARHVATEIERVRVVAAELSGTAPAHERFVTIGKALYRSHASLEVDYELSSPMLNAIVDGAFQAGALGARLVEGGFGGAVVALVRRAQAQTTAKLIAQMMLEAGFDPPRFSMI